MRTVQTIATLSGVFVHLGEFCLFTNLTSCAARTSQSIGINEDKINISESALEGQYRRRLYWSLVICDWLCLPLTVACIDEHDFSVGRPLPMEDVEISADMMLAPATAPRHIHYMLAMSRICCVVRRFQKFLTVRRPVEEIVSECDNELAEIIGELPEHLRTDSNATHRAFASRESEQVTWQRQNIMIVLFYYRIVINRVLRENSIKNSPAYDRAVAICFDSAHGIVDTIAGPTMTTRQLIW